jgi:hypothetical protein
MNQNPEPPTLETLQVLAARAGLKLTDDELKQMQAGIGRSMAMGEAVRVWLYDTLEPATVFTAASPTR